MIYSTKESTFGHIFDIISLRNERKTVTFPSLGKSSAYNILKTLKHKLQSKDDSFIYNLNIYSPRERKLMKDLFARGSAQKNRKCFKKVMKHIYKDDTSVLQPIYAEWREDTKPKSMIVLVKKNNKYLKYCSELRQDIKVAHFKEIENDLCIFKTAPVYRLIINKNSQLMLDGEMAYDGSHYRPIFDNSSQSIFRVYINRVCN